LTTDTLTVDHAVARALGGADHPENLQATCKRCNNLKSRLEGALRQQRERGVRSPAAVAEALATIANARERERFASHPSVRPLLDALIAPEAGSG
jgi:5-methylcytosine-specific restriction endonuclease McrA